MPTTTEQLSRTAFFQRLGVTPAYYYRLRDEGIMPIPPRLPDSRYIVWSVDYLKKCRDALDEVRRLTDVRRRLTRKKMKELSDRGVL